MMLSVLGEDLEVRAVLQEERGQFLHDGAPFSLAALGEQGA